MSYPSQVGGDITGTKWRDFGKCSYLNFFRSYCHQTAALQAHLWESNPVGFPPLVLVISSPCVWLTNTPTKFEQYLHILRVIYCVYIMKIMLSVFSLIFQKDSSSNAWKVSKYGVTSGLLYFPVFGLNTGKCGPEITPCLGTFHAVMHFFNSSIVEEYILHFPGFLKHFLLFLNLLFQSFWSLNTSYTT